MLINALDQLHVEDGISAFAVRSDNKVLAIGTRGMLGVYQINSTGEGDGQNLKHYGSFILPDDTAIVRQVSFLASGEHLIIQTDQGHWHKLSMQKRAGFLIEENLKALIDKKS